MMDDKRLDEYKQYNRVPLDWPKAAFIPMDDMKPYYLYRVNCRNSRYGIWLPAQEGCMGRRQKWYDWFLFTEYHYDTGPPFGTLRPLTELEKSPFGPDDFEYITKTGEHGEYQAMASYDEIFKYLKEKEIEYDAENG